MQSRGFTLFEVLVSLVILSVMLLCIGRLYKNDNSLEVYAQLQAMENRYIETGTLQNTEHIKFNTN